jgi:hypothetical protein
MHESVPERIAELEFPDDVGVISLCDMREMPSGCHDGIYPRRANGTDGNGWWGNQAMLIHPETVALLDSFEWFCETVEGWRGVRAHAVAYADNGKNCSDIRMSMIVHHFGGYRNKYAVHVPSLFRHMGQRSVCFPERLPELGERETRNWIGDRYTAVLPSQTTLSFWADANNPYVADSLANTEDDIEVSKILRNNGTSVAEMAACK